MSRRYFNEQAGRRAPPCSGVQRGCAPTRPSMPLVPRLARALCKVLFSRCVAGRHEGVFFVVCPVHPRGTLMRLAGCGACKHARSIRTPIRRSAASSTSGAHNGRQPKWRTRTLGLDPRGPVCSTMVATCSASFSRHPLCHTICRGESPVFACRRLQRTSARTITQRIIAKVGVVAIAVSKPRGLRCFGVIPTVQIRGRLRHPAAGHGRARCLAQHGEDSMSGYC